jgi:hypothetical protein
MTREAREAQPCHEAQPMRLRPSVQTQSLMLISHQCFHAPPLIPARLGCLSSLGPAGSTPTSCFLEEAAFLPDWVSVWRARCHRLQYLCPSLSLYAPGLARWTRGSWARSQPPASWTRRHFRS